MAKAQALDGDDLIPVRRELSGTKQRGAPVPSSELIPLQFKMPPEFVREFKIVAATDGYKLNELLKECFEAFKKSRKQ